MRDNIANQHISNEIVKRKLYSFCAEQKERRSDEQSLRDMEYQTGEIFPWLEERLDPLSDKEQQFVRVVCLVDLPKHMQGYRWIGIGRKREDRVSIAKAFVAKAVYSFETTKVLIECVRGCKNLRRLCGWEARGDIPSESTFCRAFGEYSHGCLPQKIHEAMVKEHCGDKLVGHVSRDATAIEARETREDDKERSG